MKHLKLIIALLLATLCWQSAMAVEFVIDGLRYEKYLYYDYVTAYSTDETVGDIVIPSSVEYHDVTYTVGAVSINNCDGITSLVLPNTISYLSVSYCENLKSVDLSAAIGLKNMHDYGCFSFCPSLETVVMPDVGPWSTELTSFGKDCFGNCAIKSFVIPYGIEKLSAWSFSGCNLDYLVIPSTVKEIEEFVGGNIKKLIFLGETLPTFTKDSSFGALDNTIYCDSFLVKEGRSVDGDWSSHIVSQYGLGYVKLVNNVKFDVSELTIEMGETRQLSFTITPNDATIKEYRMSVDGAAVSVTQDGKVTGVRPGKSTVYVHWLDDLGGFSYTNSCKVTVLNNGTVATDSVDVIIDDLKYRLYQPTNTATVISNNKIYSGDIVIPSTVAYDGTSYSVNAIGEGAFQGCEDLTSVDIPSSASWFGKNCFSGCTNLMSAPLPEGLNIVPEGCYNGCSSLENIVIPESVTKLKPYAFAGCQMDSIILPKNIITVGNSCFKGCGKLISLTSLATTVPWAHDYWGINTSSTTLYVPKSALDDYKATAPPWSSCANILPLGTQVTASIDGIKYVLDLETQTATVPNNGTRIAGAINIPSTVTYEDTDYRVTAIDDKAFMNSNISSITIGTGVSVGDSCFVGCLGLKSVALPDDLTSVPDYCFYKCSTLTSINFPKSLTTLGEKSFENCSTLDNVILPENATTIGAYCFILCKGLNTMISLATTPPTISAGTLPIKTLYVYEESLEAYKAASAWAKTSNILPIITGITLPESISVEPQKTISLEVALQPNSATADELAWASSDERIATVDADGIVTGISLGTAIITATSKDGLGATGSCQVTVTNQIDGIESITSEDEFQRTTYYTLDGIKLQGKPQKEGVYIRHTDGKSEKVVVKRK